MSDVEFEEVDLPVTIGREQAREIATRLKSGESVTLEIGPDVAPDLAGQIEWQLENDRPVTTLAQDYTEDKNQHTGTQ